MSTGDKWKTFDAVLKEETNAWTEEAQSECKEISTDILSDALEKAKELIKINEATDVPTLVAKMREKFITNRIDTATKGEQAVNLALTRLIDKLNTEDMPVNTLLKILTQLRDSSIQDMSAMLGAPDPNDKYKGNSPVINILNNNGSSQSSEIGAPVVTQKGPVDATSDITKFLEVSTMAIENIKSGKVEISEETKNKVVDAEFSEVNNESR